MKRIVFLFAVILSGSVWTGCEDALNFPPEDVVLREDALQTPEDLQMLLNSCYDVLANTYNGNSQNLSEVLSDNLAAPNQNEDLTEIYIRRSNFFNGTINNYFKQPYIAVYRCNTLLEGVDQISGVSDADRTRIVGEARFIRAFAYFDLIQKFAQPYGFTSDNSHDGIALRTNTGSDPIPRSSVGAVYDLMISDLEAAAAALPAENGGYATSHAANGLLAKVYMNMMDYQQAADYASLVINSGVFSFDPGNRYSQTLSPEAVFSIISSNEDRRSAELNGKYQTNGTGQPNLTIRTDLYQLMISDTSDSRNQWITVINEGQANELYGYNRFDEPWFNIPIIHLSDLKLIRAEALARQNTDLATAIEDVNDIIRRAYGDNTTNVLDAGAQPATIIAKAQYERRIECFGEGTWVNHLKRRGVEGENILIRQAPWDCPGMVLQFPISERTNNFEMNPEGGCE